MLSLRTIKKSIMTNAKILVDTAESTAAKIIAGTLDLGRPDPVVQPVRRPRSRSFTRRLTEQEIDIRDWNAKVDAANEQRAARKRASALVNQNDASHRRAVYASFAPPK